MNYKFLLMFILLVSSNSFAQSAWPDLEFTLRYQGKCRSSEVTLSCNIMVKQTLTPDDKWMQNTAKLDQYDYKDSAEVDTRDFYSNVVMKTKAKAESLGCKIKMEAGAVVASSDCN
ncbi:hypothetical protein [Pseudobdellovibrio sp. HCB154]|uniref:hypothetical protein n=1 Tax=Pseudobdellovibrio sp. HCB154 TaxID=3386277 RepID=UPI003916F931